MLEVVHVDVAAIEADVGSDPVAELDQLDIKALLLGFAHRRFKGGSKGRRGADLERGVAGEHDAAEQSERQNQWG